MTENELNEKYIRGKLQGVCQDCIYFDMIIPIIRQMLSERYIDGLRQGHFDNKMDVLKLEIENSELKEKIELLNEMNEENYKFHCDILKELNELKKGNDKNE